MKIKVCNVLGGIFIFIFVIFEVYKSFVVGKFVRKGCFFIKYGLRYIWNVDMWVFKIFVLVIKLECVYLSVFGSLFVCYFDVELICREWLMIYDDFEKI